jgi:hypothetical protein
LYLSANLSAKVGFHRGIDFTRLRDQTIETQCRSEVAFRTFTEHVASHQCGEATQNGQGHLHPQSNTFLDCNFRTGIAE